MKQIICTLTLLSFVITLLYGCANKEPSSYTDSKSDNKNLSVVTTLFPQYDFAKEVAGDTANVTLLLTPGMESHSYEPTPADVIAINGADLFIYTGAEMEPWVPELLNSLDSHVTVLDISKNIPLDQESHDNEDHHTGDGHIHNYDPHIWTSPKNAKIMVSTIETALSKINPQQQDYYEENATCYQSTLSSLDSDLEEVVKQSDKHTLVFGGRFAFHYLTRDYGLSYLSPYDSCSSETEPSVKTITSIIDYIKENNVPVIFYEELTTPTVAKVISEDTGAQMLLLHSCHNVTKQELENHVTYESLMRQNIENIRKGLE